MESFAVYLFSLFLADWRVVLQDLWHDHLFHICLAVLHIYLGQDDHQAPEIPQEPDSLGNQTNHGVDACHVFPDCSLFGCRGSRLRQAIRFVLGGAI